jgi:hypothetical protein
VDAFFLLRGWIYDVYSWIMERKWRFPWYACRGGGLGVRGADWGAPRQAAISRTGTCSPHWAEGLASRREGCGAEGAHFVTQLAAVAAAPTTRGPNGHFSRLAPRAGSPASRGLPAAGSADLGVCRTWILIIQRIDRGGGWTRSSAL